MARRESAHSVRQDCFLPEQCSPFVPVMEKQRQSAAPEAVMHLAKLRRQAKSQATPGTLLPGNCRTKVTLLVQQPAKPQLFELQVHLKDSRLRRVTEIPLLQARARQCSRDPGPFAFFREIPDAEKCNPAARCGDLPIFARYRRRCNRRGFVGYGNRRSRLLHTRARPAGTFPIVGADKCQSPLRRIED
jgi:hypothetical protein